MAYREYTPYFYEFMGECQQTIEPARYPNLFPHALVPFMTVTDLW